MRKLYLFFVAFVLGPGVLFAQGYEWLRGATYDSTVPTPESVLGYEIGTYFTDHYQMVDYMHKLASATDRVQVFKYGQSYERRDLYIVVISSPQNMQRLEEIRTTIERLADPRETSELEAREIAKETPAIGWANFGTDGNENTALETSMQLAYQLAAGQDPLTEKILENVVTIINPSLSPDSLQRYATWIKAVTVGRKGSPSPDASEHHRDWMMDTNQNHFGIDVNRDAFTLSIAVTRAAAEIMHHWNPQTWIDNHGTPDEYFFAPFASPVNLNYPPSLLKWATEIGKNNARYFSEYGWTFYKDENFDIYYPGYWDSYPAFYGAIAATYETDGGGSKALIYELEDGTMKTLRDGVHHHFMTNMSTLEVLADNREEMLWDFYNFRKVGMDEADSEAFKTYVLLPGADKGRLASLVELLLRHKIEMYEADAAFSSQRTESYFDRTPRARELPAGSFIIPLKQPQKRVVKTLFEPDPKMEDVFMKGVEARRARDKKLGPKIRKEGHGFYDVTAWALPLTWGIDAAFTEDVIPVNENSLVTQKPETRGGVVGGRAGYAYLFTYLEDGGAKLCGRLLQEGYNVSLALQGFTNSGRDYPKGTLLVRVERNPESLHTRIDELARECGIEVYATNTGWADSGISFGSRYVVYLRKPRIMVLSDAPTRSTAHGSIWHLLEVRYGLAFTDVRTEYFADVDLSHYNVIIFPDGSAEGYQRMLGEDGISHLKAWIDNGGTLIGVKGGAAFAVREGVELADVELITEVPDKEAEQPAEGEGEIPEKPIENIPGSIFRAVVNNDYYLGLGYPDEIAVQFRGNVAFSQTQTGANVVTYAQGSHIMGHKWEDTEEILSDKLYLADVPLGRGHVILFANDPTFRNYWRGLDRLFLSGVLFASAMH